MAGEEVVLTKVAVDAELTTPESKGSNKEIVWLCGLPGSGKTWFGDYLATRGWHHVDGDYALRSGDKALKAAWDKYIEGWEFPKSGEKVPDEYWMPQYENMLQWVMEGLSEHDKVVISHFPYGTFGEQEMLAKELPGVKVILIDVEIDTLVVRSRKRFFQWCESQGFTPEAFWAMDNPHCNKMRAKYGEEYTVEGLAQSTRDMYSHIHYPPMDKGNEHQIKNDDFDSGEGIKAIDELLGLQPLAEVDTAAISEVNNKRLAHYKME